VAWLPVVRWFGAHGLKVLQVVFRASPIRRRRPCNSIVREFPGVESKSHCMKSLKQVQKGYWFAWLMAANQTLKEYWRSLVRSVAALCRVA
jgi:hypothetical protein